MTVLDNDEHDSSKLYQKSSEGLSEEVKKANHIASEKRRRTAIREQFDNLAQVVPNLDEKKSKSEATVLEETVNYLKSLLEENKQLRACCKANSITVVKDDSNV